MIVARIVGGLGNQLYVLAAGFELAQRMGVDLAIDSYTGYVKSAHAKLYRYRLDAIFPTIPNRIPFAYTLGIFPGRITKRMCRLLSDLDFGSVKYITTISALQRCRASERSKLIYLDGLFQSAEICKNIRNDSLFFSPFRSHISASKPPSRLAIHYRYFDDDGVKGRGNASIKYLFDSIDHFARRGVTVADIYTNQASRFRAEIFPILSAKSHVAIVIREAQSDIADFYELLGYSNFCLCNSTYGIWAAMLVSKLADRQISVTYPSLSNVGVPAWRPSNLAFSDWIEI